MKLAICVGGSSHTPEPIQGLIDNHEVMSFGKVCLMSCVSSVEVETE